MPRLIIYFALCLLTLPAVHAADVTIRKTAKEANPSLALVSFSGPSAIQHDLDRTLKRCDWFTVVSASGQAQYQLYATYHDQNFPALEIRVASGGRNVAQFVERAADGDVSQLIYRSVDRVIRELFDNPGLCASKLAFVIGNGSTKEIFTSNFDGTGSKRLTHNRSISTEPAWGPAGQYLVYTLYQRNRTQVVLIDIDKSTQRRLTAFPGLNSGAAISPDRQSVVLCLSKDRVVDLYLAPLGSRRFKRLTENAAVESSPTWSPDGRQICFVSDKAGCPRLYMISAAGGSSRRLLNDADEAVSPDWSAVSNQIVFSTRQGSGQYQLAVADMNEGSPEKRIITSGAGDWEAPSWAPDGRHVVCSRQVGRERQLVMVDTRTGRVIPITKPGDISLPSWSGLTSR